jgi:hypothetical protein
MQVIFIHVEVVLSRVFRLVLAAAMSCFDFSIVLRESACHSTANIGRHGSLQCLRISH